VDKGLCPLTASAVAVEAFVNNAGQGETCPSVTVVVTRNWRVEQKGKPEWKAIEKEGY
jgi:hypothetical protein